MQIILKTRIQKKRLTVKQIIYTCHDFITTFRFCINTDSAFFFIIFKFFFQTVNNFFFWLRQLLIALSYNGNTLIIYQLSAYINMNEIHKYKI